MTGPITMLLVTNHTSKTTNKRASSTIPTVRQHTCHGSLPRVTQHIIPCTPRVPQYTFHSSPKVTQTTNYSVRAINPLLNQLLSPQVFFQT